MTHSVGFSDRNVTVGSRISAANSSMEAHEDIDCLSSGHYEAQIEKADSRVELSRYIEPNVLVLGNRGGVECQSVVSPRNRQLREIKVVGNSSHPILWIHRRPSIP